MPIAADSILEASDTNSLGNAIDAAGTCAIDI
jgi:hypothetical protein